MTYYLLIEDSKSLGIHAELFVSPTKALDQAVRILVEDGQRDPDAARTALETQQRCIVTHDDNWGIIYRPIDPIS